MEDNQVKRISILALLLASVWFRMGAASSVEAKNRQIQRSRCGQIEGPGHRTFGNQQGGYDCGILAWVPAHRAVRAPERCNSRLVKG